MSCRVTTHRDLSLVKDHRSLDAHQQYFPRLGFLSLESREQCSSRRWSSQRLTPECKQPVTDHLSPAQTQCSPFTMSMACQRDMQPVRWQRGSLAQQVGFSAGETRIGKTHLDWVDCWAVLLAHRRHLLQAF